MRAHSVWKGRKMRLLEFHRFLWQFYVVFMSVCLLLFCIHIRHCGDNTIMNAMIYGGSRLKRTDSDRAHDTIHSIWFSVGRHSKKINCNKQNAQPKLRKKWKIVANYLFYWESDTNDHITSNTNFPLFVVTNDFCSANNHVWPLCHLIRMRAIHMHDTKW